ncbi:DnaB-like helicase C-terminal domain-containing protein [Staphylococcus sp. GDX8P106P-2]|uniref:phage NrS-1 polymerase family protein n=1 Tax=Staphylococcus sp. GDX8P106P-2 TaxID=2804108 RepID=UPI001AEC46C6|nr:DnaB-like helicase C-terminal domain-containing protein [Staphylococcus sp. GDX8P106P-2]
MAITKTTNIEKVNFEQIPDELKKYDNWVLWKKSNTPNENGVFGKIAVNEHGIAFSDSRNGNKKNDKGWKAIDSNFYSFARLQQIYNPNKFDGIQFIPHGTDIIVIDLDASGEWTEFEKEIMKNGIVEKSPSGTGYHIYFKGQLPEYIKKYTDTLKGRAVFNSKTDKNKDIEIFSELGSIITVTGQIVDNGISDLGESNTEYIMNQLGNYYKIPVPSESHTEAHTEQINNFDTNTLGDKQIVHMMLENGYVSNKQLYVKDLFNGDISSYGDDQSQAEQSLLNEITFYTVDPAQIERIFRMAPLTDRKKVNTRQDYVNRSINKAIKYRLEKGVYFKSSEKHKNVDKSSENLLLNHYKNSNAGDNLSAFINGIKDSANTPPTPTGFPKLDHILNGGLREGLYVIGAISSLGKTTLVHHISDNIAINEQDVLFISLEMARTELMSKSISRETYFEAMNIDGNSKNAKVSVDITDGTRHKNFSDKEKDVVKNAIKNYSKYAGNMYIVEAFGQIGHEDIKKLIEVHETQTGKTPIVVIDYLQILKPSDPRQTDKANTDVAVNSLKRISRDHKTPIIAISSLNRESYNKPMSLSSFKESGAIEYSSDVLIGLDFTQMLEDASEMDFEKEKDNTPRRITLTILKNRNGRTGKRINFLYDPRFNLFEEDDYFTREPKKRNRNNIV